MAYLTDAIREYPQPIREAWATWEVLRKLGFQADDIFWVFAQTLNAVPRPGLALNVVLRTQGREFSVTCSPRLSEGEAKRHEKQARVFMETLNAGKFVEKEMLEVLHASYAWRNKSDMLMVLRAKGFEFPYTFN